MKLSIITINYNHSIGLRHTIESVLKQTCCDYEFIIIDGGSTDGSVEVIKEYSDRLDYWVSESDGGIYPAMNKGVRAAHGDYCIFMNSGDEFYSDDVVEKLSTQNLYEDIICGDICFGESNISPNPEVVTMRTFYKHTLYHQASCIKTQLLLDNPYDENMRSAADWKFFMNQLVFRNVSYRHVPFVIARFEGGGTSTTNSDISRKEVLDGLKSCLPERVLADYEDYVYGNSSYQKMFTMAGKIPPIRKKLYHINLFLLKIMNLRLKSKWIKELKYHDE